MRTFVVLMVLFGLLSGACAASRAEVTRVLPSSTAAPAATAAPTETIAPPATPLPQSIQAPPDESDLTPTPTRFSEVLSEAQTPAPTPVRGGTTLPLPDGTSVVSGGCASDGECHWYNFYWSPTHEVVMQNGEAQIKVQHELCHAHQHWSIDGGQPLAPDDYDLHTWYGTPEGRSFTAAVDGLSWPWSQSAVNGIEDFAWTCANWYLDPAHLLQASPERYAWAAANLP